MHSDNEPPMKNLAGNESMLFLFRFECRESGFSFVLNEGIAEDMYVDISARLQPLVQRSTLKPLTKFVGSGGGVSLTFDALLLNERIFYDPDTDTLTMKGVPPNLREQLVRRG